jgi:hypothetical protein
MIYSVATEDGEVIVNTAYPDVANICAWGICYQKEIPVSIVKEGEVIRSYRPITRTKSWVEVVHP